MRQRWQYLTKKYLTYRIRRFIMAYKLNMQTDEAEEKAFYRPSEFGMV